MAGRRPQRLQVYSLGIVLLMMAKLDPPVNSVFSLNPGESFSTEISELRYSDRFKVLLQTMLAWDETQRCDFVQLEQWINGTGVYAESEQYEGAVQTAQPVVGVTMPAASEAVLSEPVRSEPLHSEPVVFAPNTCAICKQPSDLSQSRQLFVGVLEGQRFLCCSKECENVLKSIKAKRKDFSCPNCQAALPPSTCTEIATSLSSHCDYSITGTCPACEEEFEYDVFKPV